jgi:hypothetical protein
MEQFNSVHEGMTELHKRNVGNKKIHALLTFQHNNNKLCKTCFLFDSKEDAGSQLVKYDRLKINNVPVLEMPAALAARQVAIDAELAEGNLDELGVVQEGHAEEFLIDFFETAVALAQDVKYVTIYITHSPCIPSDRKPSHSLPGWPASCTAKFAKLAADHPKYSFTIAFLKKYGNLQGNDTPQKFLKNLSGDRANLSFIEMKAGPPYERP